MSRGSFLTLPNGFSIGKMRQRVTIQRRTAEYDTLGREVNNFQDLAADRAAWVRELYGIERERAHQIVAEASMSVVIRAITGLTTKDRLMYGTRILQIGSINDASEGTQLFQVLLCTEQK